MQTPIGGRPEYECREGLVAGRIRASKRDGLLDLMWLLFGSCSILVVTCVVVLFTNKTLFCYMVMMMSDCDSIITMAHTCTHHVISILMA